VSFGISGAETFGSDITVGGCISSGKEHGLAKYCVRFLEAVIVVRFDTVRDYQSVLRFKNAPVL
jgi:hypothetical protein